MADVANALRMFINKGNPSGSGKSAIDTVAPTLLGMMNRQYGEKRNLFTHTDTGSQERDVVQKPTKGSTEYDTIMGGK